MEFTIAGQRVDPDPSQGVVRIKLTPDGRQVIDVTVGEDEEEILQVLRTFVPQHPPFEDQEVTEFAVAGGTPISFTLNYSTPSAADIDTAFRVAEMSAHHGILLAFVATKKVCP